MAIVPGVSDTVLRASSPALFASIGRRQKRKWQLSVIDAKAEATVADIAPLPALIKLFEAVCSIAEGKYSIAAVIDANIVVV